MIKRREPWWILVPLLAISYGVVFIGLKLLQHAFPQAFPRIQLPRVLAFPLFIGVCIGFYFLIIRPIEPAMDREPRLRPLVTGAAMGLLLFAESLIA